MSLDIYLKSPRKIKKLGTGIFVRENAEVKELTYEEAVVKYPGADIRLKTYETDEVWTGNITHNLTEMAEHVSGKEGHTLYTILWHPEMIFTAGKILSADIIPYLESTIMVLIKDRETLKKYNPENGWGTYEQLLKFTIEFYQNCLENEYAEVIVDC